MIAEYDISFNEKKYNLEKLLETDESKNALKVLSDANSEYNSLVDEISKGVASIISQVQGVSAATQQITSGIEQVVAATGEIP